MIKHKEKPCKGIGVAKGRGCGKHTYYRTHGLCGKCLSEWYNNTEEGKEKLKKLQISAKKEIQKKERKELKEERLKFNAGDAMRLADIYFSRYIRLLYSEDGYCTCFTCGKILPIKEIDNGHFEKRVHKSTRYNEDNCRPQCKTCNGDTLHNGKQKEFRANLVLEIGEKRVLEVELLAKTTIKADTKYFIEKSNTYREKVKEIQTQKGIKIW